MVWFKIKPAWNMSPPSLSPWCLSPSLFPRLSPGLLPCSASCQAGWEEDDDGATSHATPMLPCCDVNRSGARNKMPCVRGSSRSEEEERTGSKLSQGTQNACICCKQLSGGRAVSLQTCSLDACFWLQGRE